MQHKCIKHEAVAISTGSCCLKQFRVVGVVCKTSPAVSVFVIDMSLSFGVLSLDGDGDGDDEVVAACSAMEHLFLRRPHYFSKLAGQLPSH